MSIELNDQPTPAVRKILHIDMDAFYAAIEQRDNPELHGKPIAVGGSPNGRGVLATASYEARAYGLRSAMPASWAKQLCPHVHFVTPRISVYREVSQEVFAILRGHTNLVEPLSLDEAFVDVTECVGSTGSATLLAQEILSQIFHSTQLTASAGVAPNKFLAKIASDMNKPNGLTVIPPRDVESLLSSLPVGKVPGIGKKTEEKMKELGILNLGDIRALGEERLRERFGKNGSWFFRLSQGIDSREVQPEREAKSVSTEDTFSEDLLDPERISAELDTLSASLFSRLQKKEYFGRTLTLKVTYSDFTKITRSRTHEEVFDSPEKILIVASELTELTEAGSRPIRLLGLGVSNLTNSAEVKAVTEREFPYQLELKFDETGKGL